MSDSDSLSLSNKYLPWTETHKVIEIKEPTISKIELTEKELDKVKYTRESRRIGSWSRVMKLRKLLGICDCCGQTPEHRVIRYYDGLTKIERYCDSCLTKEQQKGNFDFTRTTT